MPAYTRISNRLRAVVRPLLAGLLLFGLGVATGIVAQTATDTPQRVEHKRTDLSATQAMEVIASVAEYKPGDALPRHFHHGVEVAYVLQGASIQPPGQASAMLPTGATLLNLRDVRHAGFTVVGDAPLKLFTVHVVDKGRPLYDHTAAAD